MDVSRQYYSFASMRVIAKMLRSYRYKNDNNSSIKKSFVLNYMGCDRFSIA